jgi:hypothetical protein
MKCRHAFSKLGLLYIHRTFKNIIPSSLKHPSFLPCANVKLMLNDSVHAMPCQCMFALYVRKQLSDICMKRHLRERHLRKVGLCVRERDAGKWLYWQPILT